MKPFLIIKTGGTFKDIAEQHGDFEHWTAQAMGLSQDEYRTVDVQKGEPLPAPEGFAGCAITGSHAMVTEEANWMRAAGQWLAHAVKSGLPILGICFGHQLLAHCLGGEAGYHPGGPEIGTMNITLHEAAQNDPLFSRLPSTFPAHVTHSQSALTLPADAILLASSNHEPHQAFRMGDHAWGVQFHPEFDAEATRQYVWRQADAIAQHGGDSDALAASVRDTPNSTGVLSAFVTYCRES